MFKKISEKPNYKLNSAQGTDHQRLAALINSMNDAVIAFGPNRRVELSNSAALNLFNTNSLAGKTIDEFMKLVNDKGEDVSAEDLMKRNRNFVSDSLKLVYEDGSGLSLDLNISPVRRGFGASGGGFIMLARDITLSKSLEREREEFISVASHELRTPIAISEGNISNALVLAEKAGISEPVMQSLTAAHEQVVFLSSLINDLSMLSRAEQGLSAAATKDIRLKDMLDSLVDNYRQKAQQKKLRIKCKVSSPGLTVSSNELYVKEILQNFISNSIKYTQKGEVELSADAIPGYVRLGVKDSGIGISTGEQKKLFGKFFRSGDPRVQEFSGTGLGLYVCAKLAKLLNARIEVTSEINKGSYFSLLIPLAES